jgi:hypothetical protein
MKKILILAAAIVMCANFAFAQDGGHIGIYSDSPGYSDCNVNEAIYVTFTYYIVHTAAATSNTSQFMVVPNLPPGFPGAISYAGNLNLGDLYTGVTITYVGCKVLPYLLATIQHTAGSLSPPCTVILEVVPDPALASGQIETVDCDSNQHFGTGGKLTANGNETCPCVIGTETTNWSKVKALYQ